MKRGYGICRNRPKNRPRRPLPRDYSHYAHCYGQHCGGKESCTCTCDACRTLRWLAEENRDGRGKKK